MGALLILRDGRGMDLRLGLVCGCGVIEFERREVAFMGGDFEIVDRGSKSQSGSGTVSIEIIPSKQASSILNKNSQSNLEYTPLRRTVY